MSWLAELIWYIRYQWHVAVVAFRIEAGRWYPFRDRPDWFVRQTAELLSSLKDDDPPTTREAIEMAAEEWRLRKRANRV